MNSRLSLPRVRTTTITTATAATTTTTTATTTATADDDSEIHSNAMMMMPIEDVATTAASAAVNLDSTVADADVSITTATATSTATITATATASNIPFYNQDEEDTHAASRPPPPPPPVVGVVEGEDEYYYDNNEEHDYDYTNHNDNDSNNDRDENYYQYTREDGLEEEEEEEEEGMQYHQSQHQHQHQQAMTEEHGPSPLQYRPFSPESFVPTTFAHPDGEYGVNYQMADDSAVEHASSAPITAIGSLVGGGGDGGDGSNDDMDIEPVQHYHRMQMQSYGPQIQQPDEINELPEDHDSTDTHHHQHVHRTDHSRRSSHFASAIPDGPQFEIGEEDSNNSNNIHISIIDDNPQLIAQPPQSVQTGITHQDLARVEFIQRFFQEDTWARPPSSSIALSGGIVIPSTSSASNSGGGSGGGGARPIGGTVSTPLDIGFTTPMHEYATPASSSGSMSEHVMNSANSVTVSTNESTGLTLDGWDFDSMTERSKTQWHFSNDDIRHTPSILDGSAMAQQQQPQQGTGSAPGSSSSLNSLSLQPVDAEKLLRTKGCYAVLRVGMMLKLPIDTIATACTLLHRYYMRRSFKFSNYYLISATSIFVACKIEETPRKLHDVIIYIAQRSLKNDRLWLEVASKEYQNWQNNILACESDLLDKCCFDMEMDHPHTYMVQLCKQLGIRRRFAIRAWAFVCDSLLTTLCLTHSPRVVAMASLLMAIQLSCPAPISTGEDLDTEVAAAAAATTATAAAVAASNDQSNLSYWTSMPWYVEVMKLKGDDVEDAMHEIIDLYLRQHQQQSGSAIPAPAPPVAALVASPAGASPLISTSATK